ncbi:class I SAM-dependent methyltransferase [Methanophagales archaeon]|nr:MAG: class I SAM-dependent methyltransferase [Methanophagales archaeon]RLG33675.1 MAG: methyltransferase type 11 [Methanosarcinales archaeon]
MSQIENYVSYSKRIGKNHYYALPGLPYWISYWYQIYFILSLEKNRILEIGIGDKVVSDYLLKKGLEVVTCDINSKLNPDFIADIVNLPFKNNQFDVVLCCEVLEHLPFNKVQDALKEIYRVTNSYSVISLPYYSLSFSFSFRFFFQKIRGFTIRIPLLRKAKFDGQHYWEIGKRKYPLKRIKNIINQAGFEIVDEKSVTLNPYHYFFILRKI